MDRYYKWDGSPVYAFRFGPDSVEDAIRAGIVQRGNSGPFILTTGLQEPVNTERLAAAVERLADEVKGLRVDLHKWFGGTYEIRTFDMAQQVTTDAEPGVFAPIHELFRAGQV